MHNKSNQNPTNLNDEVWFRPEKFVTKTWYDGYFGPYFLGHVKRLPRRFFQLGPSAIDYDSVRAAVDAYSGLSGISATAIDRCYESLDRRSLEEQEQIYDLWIKRFCNEASVKSRSGFNIDNFIRPSDDPEPPRTPRETFGRHLFIEGLLPVNVGKFSRITSVILRWEKELSRVRLVITGWVRGWSQVPDRVDSLSIDAHLAREPVTAVPREIEIAIAKIWKLEAALQAEGYPPGAAYTKEEIVAIKMKLWDYPSVHINQISCWPWQ